MVISILILILIGTTISSSHAGSSTRLTSFPANFSPLMPEDTSNSDTTLITNIGFHIMEEEAMFPGGDDAMKLYFINTVQYPSIALEQKIEGTVIVLFTVDANGYVNHAEILDEIGGGCEEIIIDALYNMPQWTPKKQAGNCVQSKNKFSFTFKL